MLIELIKIGLKQQLTYIFFIYGLSFVIMFYVLFKTLMNSDAQVYRYVFWMLAGFALTKGFSVWADAMNLIVGDKMELYGIIAYNLSTVFAIISNVFILQFAISLMTYKLPYRNIYQVFPIILFGGYTTLFLLGVIDKFDADMMGRNNFGYNGGILTSVALFNLYHIQKHTKRTRLLRGILGLALGFVCYSVFDGIIEKPIFGVPIFLFRMFCAVMLSAASFYIKDLFIEKKIMKVDFV